MGKYTIDDVKRINWERGYHFFDPDAMKGFNSIIESDLFPNPCFVTSERDNGMWWEGRHYASWDGKRRYTVWSFDPSTGFIDEVSDFGQFATRKAAINFAKNYSPSKQD